MRETSLVSWTSSAFETADTPPHVSTILSIGSCLYASKAERRFRQSAREAKAVLTSVEAATWYWRVRLLASLDASMDETWAVDVSAEGCEGEAIGSMEEASWLGDGTGGRWGMVIEWIADELGFNELGNDESRVVVFVTGETAEELSME